MATVEEILLPDIGDFSNVEIIEILVAPGDRVQAEQSLLTLESEKATIEIPSPKSGVVRDIKTKVGDKVSQGSPLITLEPSETAGEANDTPAPEAATQRRRRRRRDPHPARRPEGAPRIRRPRRDRLGRPAGRRRFQRHPGDRDPDRSRRANRGRSVTADAGERKGEHGDPLAAGRRGRGSGREGRRYPQSRGSDPDLARRSGPHPRAPAPPPRNWRPKAPKHPGPPPPPRTPHRSAPLGAGRPPREAPPKGRTQPDGHTARRNAGRHQSCRARRTWPPSPRDGSHTPARPCGVSGVNSGST